ncbi:TRAP transporter small permease [Alcaligenaceae bacterium]|nr:TRAP transporter small permease [Alcaligenaceae bacterium]
MTRTTLLNRYDAVLGVLDRIASLIVKVTMAVLTSVLLLQVFFRYVMNDSLTWGWDVPRVCFIWAIMFSIPLGVRYNAHVGIDLVVERFSARVRRLTLSLNAVLIMILSGMIAYYAVLLMGETWDQNMPGIPLSVGVFYASLALGLIHTCLHIGRILITGELRNEHWSET